MEVSIDTIEIPTYQRELVYVDYRDSFCPEDVEKIIHGDYSDQTDEWINEMQWTSANELADQLLADNELEHSDEDREALVERIMELDTSNPYKDLMRNTGHMLFRYSPSEDDMVWLSDELDSPEATLEALGLPAEFLPTVTEILPEIAGYKWEGGGCFGATFVFSCNPADLWTGAEEIIVSDPFLWLTNPWSGNGYGEVAEGCTVTLKMADVHVDKCAWGYGADNVFGGLLLPDSTITPITEKED
jgi:hypothetical protein